MTRSQPLNISLVSWPDNIFWLCDFKEGSDLVLGVSDKWGRERERETVSETTRWIKQLSCLKEILMINKWSLWALRLCFVLSPIPVPVSSRWFILHIFQSNPARGGYLFPVLIIINFFIPPSLHTLHCYLVTTESATHCIFPQLDHHIV